MRTDQDAQLDILAKILARVLYIVRSLYFSALMAVAHAISSGFDEGFGRCDHVVSRDRQLGIQGKMSTSRGTQFSFAERRTHIDSTSAARSGRNIRVSADAHTAQVIVQVA
jgi:hypothetical protein